MVRGALRGGAFALLYTTNIIVLALPLTRQLSHLPPPLDENPKCSPDGNRFLHAIWLSGRLRASTVSHLSHLIVPTSMALLHHLEYLQLQLNLDPIP